MSTTQQTISNSFPNLLGPDPNWLVTLATGVRIICASAVFWWTRRRRKQAICTFEASALARMASTSPLARKISRSECVDFCLAHMLSSSICRYSCRMCALNLYRSGTLPSVKFDTCSRATHRKSTHSIFRVTASSSCPARATRRHAYGTWTLAHARRSQS